MDIALARLDNGLRVVAVPMPGMFSVAVSVQFAVGSRDEDDAEAGSAHLIEHMLFKGTPRRPSAEIISETIERVGGMMNAGTDKEQTVYWARVSGGQAALAGDLLADVVRHSLLDPIEVEKERRVVLEELSMAQDDPQDWIHSVIDQQCWPSTSLGREVLGTRASVPRLNREGLLRFMEHTYVPSRTVVSIAGAIDREAALKLASELFGDWEGGAGRAPVSPLVNYAMRPPSLCYETRDTEQVNLCLAVKGVHRASEDRFALDLLTAILGGGMSSRLFVEVRERKAMAYDIHTYTNRLVDTGSLVTYAAVDPKNCREVVLEILRQLSRLRDEEVSEGELAKVKDYSKGRLLLGLEDTQSVAGWCGAQLQLQGVIMQPEEVCAAIDRVEARDIQRVAQECFGEQYLRLAALGPVEGARGLENILSLG